MFAYPHPPYATHHLQMSAFRDPIISIFTFHMSIPSQLATTGNPIRTFDTQPLPELLTRSSVLQGHSRHPPNHLIFRSQESLQINLFHRSSFTTIHEHPLNTRSIYLSFYSQGSSPRCQQYFKVHELSPSTSYPSY